LSYSAIDVASMAETRPALLADLLAAVVAMADRAEIDPLPRRVRPIERAEEGFREMAQARHIGKLVFAMPPMPPSGQPRSDVRAGYLITGGLGRLGLRVADWLGRTTGGSLVLVGRSAPATESPDVQALRGMGIDVEIVRADVSRADEVSGLMRRIQDRGLVLKGVVHAAGVLDDGLLVGLDAARMQSVMAPKILGAWNVHRATLDQPLDFFVLYSSAAAPLGSPGQANYAAANAFLDGLAHYRRALGRPAISIDWGPFALEGLAATAERGGRLALRGMESITPAQGIEVLAGLVTTDIAQLSVMSLNLRQWLQFYPRASASRLFERLVDAPPNDVSQSAGFRARLEALDPPQRRTAVQALARSEVAHVIGRNPASIATSTPFSALGVDSLMALETRNRLESATGLTLPATLLWTYPDVDRLASHLARELGVPLGETPRSVTAAPSDLVERIRDLSDAEVERMLASRFDARKQTT
jgi:acyl carrier protein